MLYEIVIYWIIVHEQAIVVIDLPNVNAQSYVREFDLLVFILFKPCMILINK